jgi:hypothetical protein
MEDSMAVDAVLWFILALMIGLIYGGCALTAQERKPAEPQQGPFDQRLDRAA